MIIILTSGQYMIYFQTKSYFIFDLLREFKSAVSGEEPSILLFTFRNSFARSFAMAHFQFAALIHPTQDVFLNAVRQHCAIFMEFFRILTGSLATCLETSRGGAEFSKPYSEEEHQDRGITLGLHYVISSEPSAVNSVLDSYLLTISTERRDALSEITFSTSEDRLTALERVQRAGGGPQCLYAFRVDGILFYRYVDPNYWSWTAHPKLRQLLHCIPLRTLHRQ